jgi:Glycosyltransferases involved in cell wall biogenesis
MRKTEMKRFTVCIPTYNRSSLVQRAIHSVLVQDFNDFELLVIDDGSTDDTKKEIEKIVDSRLRYIAKNNGGKHTALNRGFKEAEGEYFIILDSDDYLVPNCLSFLNQKINENDQELAGIMAKCVDTNHTMIGDTFEYDGLILSYLDFHYRRKRQYGDCIEAIKTSLLKEQSFPEGNYKFVPERYVFDQIGLNYKLACYNEGLKIVEYQEDGITSNSKEHLKKNAEGFLIDAFNKISVIMKKEKLPLRWRIRYYMKYWVLYCIVNNKKYDYHDKSFLFFVTKIISKVYKL